MSKKNYLSRSCKLFIRESQDILKNMTQKERKNLTYLELIKRTSFRYHNRPFDESCRKSSYRFFNEYYYTNPNVSENAKKFKEGCKLKISDIMPLLMHDIRKELLNKALDEERKISVFRQDDVYSKKQKFMLLLQNDPEHVEYTYDIIAENFDDLIDCMFKGYGGITIYFSSNKELSCFLSYIDK